jgi:predicted small lipoprotein YifL
MHIRTATVLALLSLTIAGCATSTSSYIPPTENRVINTKFVNKPFDVVWDGLVKELSSDFFVINNIDKNSRLINISFTSQRPSEFVDCGTTSRTFKNARGDQNYTYKTADAANYTAANEIGHAFNMRRVSRLDGRTNIYVAPENNGTNITVNTKYVISVTLSGTALDGRSVGSENYTFDPSTKQSFTNGSITCAATGTIEDRILRAAQLN